MTELGVRRTGVGGGAEQEVFRTGSCTNPTDRKWQQVLFESENKEASPKRRGETRSVEKGFRCFFLTCGAKCFAEAWDVTDSVVGNKG